MVERRCRSRRTSLKGSQDTRREFARYLKIAVNSAAELEYHLITGRDIGAIGKPDFLSLLNQLVEVRKMLHGLLNYARKSEATLDATTH